MEALVSDYKPTEFEGFLRKYTTDQFGNKVIRGLTFDETKWYREYQEKDIKYRANDSYFPWSSVEQMHEERDRWLELHNRYEKARFEALGAEHILRTERLPIN